MADDCLSANATKTLPTTQILFSSEIIETSRNNYQRQQSKELQQDLSPSEENSDDAGDLSTELISIANNNLNDQAVVDEECLQSEEVIAGSDEDGSKLTQLERINLETPIVEDSSHFYQKSEKRPKRISDDFFSSDEGDEEKSDSAALSPEKESSPKSGNSSGSYAGGGNSSQDDERQIADEFLEDDTNSLSSNLLSISNEESQVQKSSSDGINELINSSDDLPGVLRFASSTRDEHLPAEFGSLQSVDVIDGDCMNVVNLEMQRGEIQDVSENEVVKDLPTTPTSSRCNSLRPSKSTAKFNFSATLDELCATNSSSQEKLSLVHGSHSSRPQTSTINIRIDKPHDLFSNSNSDDSLSSDKSYSAAANQPMNFFNESQKNELVSCGSEQIRRRNLNGRNQLRDLSKETVTAEPIVVRKLSKAYSDPIPSTSSHNSISNFYEGCSRGIVCTARNIDKDDCYTGGLSFPIENESQTTSSGSLVRNLGSSSANFVRATIAESLVFEELGPLPGEHTEADYDDETWADCDDPSDEEICTCHSHPCSGGGSNSFIENELPSKDVDLSRYIQSVTISEDLFFQGGSPDIPALVQRKRKLIDGGRVNEMDTCGGGTPSIGRKRMAIECPLSPKTPVSQRSLTTTSVERRSTPRSIIPTKDNPPPELQEWITQFQRWSHCERLVAVDKLIEHCEPTQVRHMMKVIEPQFQRDFISLLPKELALQVLSYLEPRDLLRAAQTCRSWRFLCDDNLLWKEKCRQGQILTEPNSDRPKRGRAGNMPLISSPWKAAYMREHMIEMNWRSRPIREPKILKGHDDHVITCLQFYGNRIVSGSDDNTLKVWSAVTGKCLRTLVGHTGGVWSSQLAGNVIISGSTDRTLKVWNMDTGQCIHTLQGHTSTVRCMHLHGKKVVSGSRDATLRVWDIEQGTCLHVLERHEAAVRCVQYDGKIIVSGAYDYMVKVWNPEREECLHTLSGHTNRVYSLQFDGIHIVSGSLDTTIRVWDAETGSCKHILKGHQSLTSGMELRQNILVSGNADSTVKVWDITTGQCLQTLSGPNKHQSAVTCLQFNSRFVITSSDDGTVKLWDVKTGEFIRNLVALDSGGSGGVVWRIRASDTKLICAVGSRNGTEETKLMVLDFDVDGACAKCS